MPTGGLYVALHCRCSEGFERSPRIRGSTVYRETMCNDALKSDKVDLQ